MWGKVLDAVGDATAVLLGLGAMDAGPCPHVHRGCCPWLMGDVPEFQSEFQSKFQSTGVAPAPGGTERRG